MLGVEVDAGILNGQLELLAGMDVHCDFTKERGGKEEKVFRHKLPST